jgi:hypothetical protein
MWQLFNQIWEVERIPEDWEENIIVPIHKKGDTLNCDNYRAICLSVVILKVFSDIIEKRLRELVEDNLEEEQAAYRKGRQTQDHICVLRSVTKKAIDTDSPIYLAFVDLKVAFDTVPKKSLWKALDECGIDMKLKRLIQSMHKNVYGIV